MKTRLTQYQVVKNGRSVLTTGNLQQCWMYLSNVYGADTTIAQLSEMKISIEPEGRE